jgi:hypothetical protein
MENDTGDREGPGFQFRMLASGKRLLGVNLAGILGGGVLLYFILRARGAPGVFLPLFTILALWLAGDWIWWSRKGLREIRLDGSRIEVVRGRAGKMEPIEVSAISEIWLHQRGRRKSLQLLLGGRALRLPGFLTLYPYPKLWLTNDSFVDAEFDELVDRLERLYGRINRLG